HARAAESVIGAALGGRLHRVAEVAGHVLERGGAGIGGEAGPILPAVAQAVAEDDDVAELGCARCLREREREGRDAESLPDAAHVTFLLVVTAFWLARFRSRNLSANAGGAAHLQGQRRRGSPVIR